MKIIEVIYPELLGIYAEKMNIKYLSLSSSEIKIIETNLNTEPYLVKHKVDMVYMGAMSEKDINICIKALMKYKSKIKSMIESNVVFLVTGNALDVFGKYILEGDKKLECLGVFDYYVRRDMSDVCQSQNIGRFNNIELMLHFVGFSSICDSNYKFIDIKGKNEGVNYKNFYGTYSLGPFLILNPMFCEFLLKKIGIKSKPAFYKEVKEAYNDRLKKLKIYLGVEDEED